MSDLIPHLSQSVIFDQKEILPYGKVGHHIDWNKVFRDKIGVFYPKPIDWRKSTNSEGAFDVDAFNLARSGYEEKRSYYLELIERYSLHLERYSQREGTDAYDLLSVCKNIKQAFEKMHILGAHEENVYTRTFYLDLVEIMTQLESNNSLGDGNGLQPIFDEIRKYITQSLEREKKERAILIEKDNERSRNCTKKYLKDDGVLNVDQVLTDLNSHRDWNEEAMLIAFYTGTCTKAELERLQTGVIDALNSKVKRLDTYKVFIILERILPYIHEEFKINWDLPEIFHPQYLSHITIRDLDLERFTAQVKNRGKELQWPEEIQEKLIKQFKEFGTNKEGNIGFGQGSEQLRYRNGVTAGVNAKNYQHYLKKTDLGEAHIPTPRILQNEDSLKTKESLIKTLKE